MSLRSWHQKTAKIFCIFIVKAFSMQEAEHVAVDVLQIQDEVCRLRADAESNAAACTKKERRQLKILQEKRTTPLDDNSDMDIV